MQVAFVVVVFLRDPGYNDCSEENRIPFPQGRKEERKCQL
jgi:hypothetical protein